MSRNQIRSAINMEVTPPQKRQSKLVQFSFLNQEETDEARLLRKRQNFQKLITKEFVNSERIEFSQPYEEKKEKKTTKSLKEIVREARQRYQRETAKKTQSAIVKSSKQTEVLDYFRQREQKIKKMKYLSQQQDESHEKMQRDWTELILTVLLGIGMAVMWKEIIRNIYIYFTQG